jgi:hypothetical protein
LINQSDKFEIILGEKDKKSKKYNFYDINYHPPEILEIRQDRKAIDIGEFSFDYPGYGIINCKYEIFVSKHNLLHTGDSREAGLLICAGSFSVLDCALFEHGGKVAQKFFGNVFLSGPIRSICKNEKILEDKRESGLIKKSPLYDNLYKRFYPILEKLIDSERKRLNKSVREVSKKLLDNKMDLIKEFNKIDRDETEESSELKGSDKFEPGPNAIRFCAPHNFIKLIERQSKSVFLVVDTNTISIGSEIEITSNKEGIDFDPIIFPVTDKETNERDVFKKKITFESNLVDTFLVTASVKNMLNKAELNIEVLSDPRLAIKNPIEFIPHERNIVEKKQSKFALIIDFSKVNTTEKLTFEIDTDIFTISKHIKLLKDSEKIYNEIHELLIPVYCSGRPGQKGSITARIGSDSAKLKLTVIDKKDIHLKGDFKGIKDDEDPDPDELGYYEPTDKFIYICRQHPILRHYRSNKAGENSIPYRLLYADVIIREFCKVLTRKNVRTFENVSAEDYRVRFNQEYDKIYKKHATRLHKFCINPKNIEKIQAK